MLATPVRPPVQLPQAFADPSIVERLLVEHQPYWPVQRYMANRAEYATLSGASAGSTPADEMPVAPVFRGDWAFGGQTSAGVDEVLHHEPFIEAARQLFGERSVRPHTVYVNLTWQLPFAQGRGHVDIPAFQGFDRSTVPVTFLTIMGQTALFEDERVDVATAVAWFYGGSDGGFEFWPEGPTATSVLHEGVIQNTAVVGDNDFMWHRVRPLGRPEDGMVSLSLDASLEHRGDDRWAIVDDGDERASFGRNDLRVSLSWKADVGALDADPIDETDVLTRIASDLERRGVDPRIPSQDPLRDPTFITRLQDVYMRYPD